MYNSLVQRVMLKEGGKKGDCMHNLQGQQKHHAPYNGSRHRIMKTRRRGYSGAGDLYRGVFGGRCGIYKMKEFLEKNQ